MKHLIKLAFIFAAFLAAPGVASAQNVGSYSAEFYQNPTAERAGSWWKGLSKEVNLRASSYKEVKSSDIQQIIFFATHYGESMNFSASVPSLVHVYRYHDNESMRIMALAALARIGDVNGIDRVRETLSSEESPRVRRMTIAVLRSYNDTIASR